MAIDNADLQLFQIIYSANPDKPIEFIQEEVLKAKKALLDNSTRMEQEENKSEEKPKKHEYAHITKADLMFKTRSEIDAAMGDDYITCCICNRKMKSLGAHLKRVHNINPDDYIKVCGYEPGTSLMAKKTYKAARANIFHALEARKARIDKKHDATVEVTKK